MLIVGSALSVLSLLAAGPWGEKGFQVAATAESSIAPKCGERVKEAYRAKGVELKSPKGWGWWLKPLTTDMLEIGKRMLPTKGGLMPLPEYREILDSLGGTDGYAIIRSKTDPHILHLFGARDAGTLAATEDFLKNGYTGDKIVRKGEPQRDQLRWRNKGRKVEGRPYARPEGAGEVFEFTPDCWINDTMPKGCTFAQKRDKDGHAYLEIVQSATATNGWRLKTIAGGNWKYKKLIAIPRYGAVVFDVEADAEWSGGGLSFVGPGWKTGANVPLSGGYEKPYHSWNWQRGSHIGCFHTPPDQKLAMRANPREKIPANRRVSVTNSLSAAWSRIGSGHAAYIVQLDMPGNWTGKPRTFKFHAIKFIENVTDDEYLERSKAFDAKMAAYEPDYSDSSKYLAVPKKLRLPRPFAVVSHSNAVASIALPEGEVSPCLLQAAAELNKYVKRLTGVELPVVRGEAKNAIRLGFGAFAKAGGKDGYRISYADGSIAIDGGNAKGVMNGVFALLENNTDIIWAHPNEKYGTVFTPTPGELTFLWGDGYEAVPETPGRGWNGYAFTEWMSHNKCDVFNCGGGGDITWMNEKKTRYGVLYTRHMGGHNIFHFMAGAPTNAPVGYYACDPAGVRTGGNPCFSSEKLLALFTRNVLSALRFAPDDTDEIYINLQDTWKSCLCEKCRAPIVFENGVRVEPTDENFFSTRYFLFMNRVAEEVRREFPAKRIATLAYFGSLPTPACEVHPNLTPEYAPYPRGNDKTPLYHPDNRLHMQHLDDWYDLVGPNRLQVYGYHGLGLNFPRPVSETMAEDFKVLNERTLYVSSEYPERNCEALWDYSSMEFWVMTRLMWNTKQNVESLRKYFLRRVYHDAAPAMERFYGTIRREYYHQEAASGLGGGSSNVALTKALITDPGHTDAMRGYLAEAEKLAKLPQSQEFVRRIRKMFERDVENALKAKKK